MSKSVRANVVMRFGNKDGITKLTQSFQIFAEEIQEHRDTGYKQFSQFYETTGILSNVSLRGLFYQFFRIISFHSVVTTLRTMVYE